MAELAANIRGSNRSPWHDPVRRWLWCHPLQAAWIILWIVLLPFVLWAVGP